MRIDKDHPGNLKNPSNVNNREAREFVVPIALTSYLEDLRGKEKDVAYLIGNLATAESYERAEQIINRAGLLDYISPEEAKECVVLLGTENGKTLDFLKRIDEGLTKTPDPGTNHTPEPILTDISIESKKPEETEIGNDVSNLRKQEQERLDDAESLRRAEKFAAERAESKKTKTAEPTPQDAPIIDSRISSLPPNMPTQKTEKKRRIEMLDRQYSSNNPDFGTLNIGHRPNSDDTLKSMTAFDRQPPKPTPETSRTRKMFEGIYKASGISTIVDKLKLSYNQASADKHEKRSVDLKTQIDSFDVQTRALDQSRKEIEAIIADLRDQRMPGAESLQLKLKVIEAKKRDLLNKKDRIQSNFEASDNRKKLYTNERDRLADKFISKYDQKIAPMEKELEELQTYKDEVDLQVTVMGIRHKGELAKLGKMEKNKVKIEQALKGTGMSEKQIRNFEAMKVLEYQLAQGREKIEKEREEIEKRKVAIDNKIAKVDERANPYRDKREEFVRVKEGRPLEIKVPVRQRTQPFTGAEEPSTHPREEGPAGGRSRVEPSGSFEAPQEMEVENQEEREERWPVSTFITEWNNDIRERYGSNSDALLVDQRDFLRATKLSEDTVLSGKDLGAILEKYYKLKKMKMDRLREVMAYYAGDQTI